MTPTFSIIIPVYNVAPYLRECLDSVLAQTYTDWEAICVDDGSTDGSAAILDKYAEEDARFRVVHRLNAGVSAARNAGICISTGKYITFLDGDDIYDTGWLAEAARIVAATNVDVVRLRAYMFPNSKKDPSKVFHEYVEFGSPAATRAWGMRVYAHEGWAWLSFFRSEIVKKIAEPFPVGMKFMEDNIFSLKTVLRCESAVQGEYVGYGYRQRESSACQTLRSVERIEQLFDEAISLCCEEDRIDRVEVGRMLCRVVIGSQGKWLAHEVDADQRVAQKIRQATLKGAILWDTIPNRFRWGLKLYARTGSRFWLEMLIWLQTAWGVIRRILRCWRLAK